MMNPPILLGAEEGLRFYGVLWVLSLLPALQEKTGLLKAVLQGDLRVTGVRPVNQLHMKITQEISHFICRTL